MFNRIICNLGIGSQSKRSVIRVLALSYLIEYNDRRIDRVTDNGYNRCNERRVDGDIEYRGQRNHNRYVMEKSQNCSQTAEKRKSYNNVNKNYNQSDDDSDDSRSQKCCGRTRADVCNTKEL